MREEKEWALYRTTLVTSTTNAPGAIALADDSTWKLVTSKVRTLLKKDFH